MLTHYISLVTKRISHLRDYENLIIHFNFNRAITVVEAKKWAHSMFSIQFEFFYFLKNLRRVILISSNHFHFLTVVKEYFD